MARGFRGTGHVFDRPPIRFQRPGGNFMWEDFFDSLVRNLHVSDDVEKYLREREVGFRFDVRAHHFTVDVVSKYWNNNKIWKRWAMRFSREEAQQILYLPLDQ